MTPSERSWRSQLLASAGIEKETMRARWIISAILVILPAGSPSAQQSHLDTRYQIEQMAATFAEHYNKQDAAALASMFTKDAPRVYQTGLPLALERKRSRSPLTHSSKPGLLILS